MIRVLTNTVSKRPDYPGSPRFLPVWLLILSALVLGAVGFAQCEEISREYPLKAAFLYNFGSYVEWPAEAFKSAQSPIVIGVVGPSRFGMTLDEMAATKKIRGRPIVVKYLVPSNEPSNCHILFISDLLDDAERIAAVDATRMTNVLVVGESAGMAENGAVVNFFVEQNKVRFEINIQAARQRQLKVSSKLLSLAKVVDPAHVAGN